MPEMIPVGNTIQPPNPSQTLGTLSSLIGIQQQRQLLQTGQYIQEQEQAGAQQQQEQMVERQKLQQFMQGGMDTDGTKLDPNRDDYGTRVANWARGNLPLIGNDVAQTMIKTQSDKISLRSSVADLQQKYRTGLGGIVGGFVGSNAPPGSIHAAVDEYIRQNPDAAEAGHWAGNLLDHVDRSQDQNARDRTLATIASELSGTPQQEPGTIDTGTQLQPVGVNKFGLGVTPQGSAIAKSDIISLSSGQQARLNKATGQYELIHGTGGGGGGGKGSTGGTLTADTDPMKPSPNDPAWRQANYGGLVDQANKDVKAAQDTDANYGANMATSDMIRDLSNKAQNTGPGTPSWVQLTGSLGSRIGQENVATYQTLGSFLDLQAARLRDVMGLPPTNLGLATSKEMGTSIESQRNAIQAKTDYYQALTELNHRYRTGLDQAGNRGVNSSPTAVNQFKSDFTKHADPIAMELRLAHDRGDTDAVQRILTSFSQPQRAQIAMHGRYLDQLMGQ